MSFQAIRSIDRRNLNEHLLTEAEKYDSVHLHFEHKLARADMTKNHLTFNTYVMHEDGTSEMTLNSYCCSADGKVEVDCDFIFGCDGAHSQVRKSLMRRARYARIDGLSDGSLQPLIRVDFQQFYIPHGYKELTIPPGEDGTVIVLPAALQNAVACFIAITTQWWASLGEFQLKPDHLHIWPRSSFMMIALPNLVSEP
jgi:kynurenine 3-monooxygenase